MQTPLTSVSETTSDTPSHATRHKALQEEYSQLLEHLRHSPATPTALTDRFMKTRPFSPLYMDEKKKPPAATDLPDTSAGYFSLAHLAAYYGLAPWDRTDEAMHQSRLDALDEKRARHALQLESGIDIDELACATSKPERKALIDRPRSASFETLLASLTESKINDAVREFLPAAETSLIGHLVKSLPSETNVVDVRPKPTVYLEKILQSTDADRLAQSLLEKLGWYGGNPGEETSRTVRYKLLSRAIRLWERRDTGTTRDIAGYQWHKRSNYGKSYQTIWAEFETHLQESGRASSSVEAILLAALYRFEFPGDFHRSDVPDDLAYKSSLVWVNFVHGLNLAEVVEPYRVPHMTFQQLVDFPLRELETATDQERELIAWSRIPPTMDWAIANGIVQEDIHASYSEATQQRAMEALDQQSTKLTDAILQMGIDPPKRPDIADQEIRKVFGNQVFTTDGRKLVRYHGPASGAGARQLPDLKQKRESFHDVYMWKKHANQNWLITRTDGETTTTATFSLDADGAMHTTASWIPPVIRDRTLPDVNKLFETQYQTWLTATRAAYKTLLTHLFSCLPHDDLQAIEYGETKIYTLRDATKGLEADQETASLTMPLRLRMGLILRLSNNGETSWYECLPRAGIIRKRTDITNDMLNGRITTEKWRVRGTVRVQVRRGQSVPFDWNAHEKGHVPKKGATCTAIIEQLGNTYTPEPASGYPPHISSNRAAGIAADIAKSFFYYDEDALYAESRKQTSLERLEEKRHTLLDKLVKFVPFFGNLDDLDSDNPNERISAIFGLYADSLAFALPLGKFASGTVKLASTAVSTGYKHVLPQFSHLVKKLVVSSLQNFNPLDGMPTLAKKLVQGLYATIRLTLISAVKLIDRLARRAGIYGIVKGLPVVSDPGRYRLLASTDELAMTRRIADVPIRKVSNTPARDYRLLDPVADKPYGPPLADKTYRLWMGRSVYSSQKTTDQLVTVRLTENAQVRSVAEIDGSTTLFIDDVPYRLDGDSLKRIDLIDDSATFKRTVCRIKRARGDGACINEYITGGPHPDTPASGSFDETKGYAPWFGERTCVPESRAGQTGKFFLRDGVPYQVIDDKVQVWRGRLTDLGFPSAKLVPKLEIQANLQFGKGIYGRIEVHGAYKGSDELHRVGAIVVPSIDGKHHHIFASPNRGDYYLATVPWAEKLDHHQTYFMKRLRSGETTTGLGAELLRVFEGSLTANNMVAVHGIDKVQQAMKTMETIAVPIGITNTPPANMRFVKVDTSAGEALMFDNRVRMSVNNLPAGSNVWSRTRDISDAAKLRTAEIFDTLFKESGFTQGTGSDLRISNAMQKLHTTLPPSLRKSGNPRNIAYAEITKVDGKREVYVSVSGGLDVTRRLPLFASHPNGGRVQHGDTTYINVDWRASPPGESLVLDADQNLLAIPRTPMALPPRPTSLDSESKLITTIRRAYPDRQSIKSIDIATTMPPCESCAVVMKAFGHTGGDIPLNVNWG